MKTSGIKLFLFTAAGFLVGMGACWFAFKKLTSTPRQTFGSCFLSKTDNSLPLALLDGKEILTDTLPSDLQNNLLQANAEHHRRVADLAEQAAVRQAAAMARGAEGPSQPLPTIKELVGDTIKDEDVRKFYENNRNSFPKSSFEQIAPMLRNHLEQQKQSLYLQEKLAELRKSKRMKLTVPLPCGPMSKSAVPPNAFQSGASTRNQLLFVSDYQCAPCRFTKDHLARVVEENPGKIQMSVVLAPKERGGTDEFLVRGAFCAQKVGNAEKFVVYNNNAYLSASQNAPTAKTPNTGNPRASAIQLAKNAGIDSTPFETCLDSKEAEEFVAINVAYAATLKLDQLPGIFFNQRRMLLPPQLNIAESIQMILDEDTLN